MALRQSLILVALSASLLRAEDGHEAWLRYELIQAGSARAAYETLPSTVVLLGDSPVLRAARQELLQGLGGMLGRTMAAATTLPDLDAIVLGTLPEVRKALPAAQLPDTAADGFAIEEISSGGARRIVITSSNDLGVLYGAFTMLRKIALREPAARLHERQEPYAPIRWVNQWDNLDGTIERGYGGPSVFFENNGIRADLGAARDYARLLASIGINGCAINNVNADPRLISPAFLPQVARIAAVFRPWGVRIAISVDFSSPQRIGGLSTFDPLDPRVAEWWRQTVDQIYASIPDLGGIVVKADSEGRLGPSAYGRTHADAANVIARALKPHGGVLFYRGFVYDHHMDWRNLKNDRARAAYDNFKPLDGLFDDNAIVQIKNGPIDFQVREPASPLFGTLERTNQVIELQITQEYFGQARHMVYLAPMWKEVLDFDLHARQEPTPVKALAAGRSFHRPVGGFVGVANVGRGNDWCGHPLSQSNLYSFGRLAWNPDLGARQIAEEWSGLTFGPDTTVVNTITSMLMSSWRTYENYTGPLGAQTLTDITGNHYGPAVEASERNGWGQWHRADSNGIGMDRTVATGTGFVGQYRPPVARVYESLSDCPDELLLFMHHVPYTHKMHSGKTVIQHIYDSHYQGAEAVEEYVRQWKSLQGKVDAERYAAVLARLQYQAGHAQVWRDAVSNWFFITSGIADARGRVGNHPGRVEAEAMQLSGYEIVDVTPWEAASGSKAIQCPAGARQCSASFEHKGAQGRFDIAIQYFDQNNGVSRFQLFIGEKPVAEWRAGDSIPTSRIDAHSSTRFIVSDVELSPGDRVRVTGAPDGGEPAALDYIEVRPARR